MVAATSTSSPCGARVATGLDPLSWIALIIFAGRCLMVAWLGEFPIPFDEHAHFSYALHVLWTGEVLPNFADLRLIDASSLDRWTDEPSYLNHPSAYYVLMAWAAAPFDLPAAELVRPWRLVNAALAVSALVVVPCLGQEAVWPAPAQAAFVTLIAFNPTLPVLGGVVTNDNLAFLGGELCCLGVFRLLAGQRSGGAWTTAGLGALLAAFAKLTAAVLCGALLACALAWLVAQEGWAVLRRWRVALCLGACCLGLLPLSAAHSAV